MSWAMMSVHRGFMEKLRIVHEDQNFCIAFWHNVAIVDVWGDLDAARMRRLGNGFRELLEEHPNGIVAMSFIRPSTPVSSVEARNEGVRFLKDLGGKMLHQAMVIEAEGIIGLMLRSVVRGVNALLKGNRMSLHDSGEHAIPAVAGYVETELPRVVVIRELTAAIAGVRASHKPPPLVHTSGDHPR